MLKERQIILVSFILGPILFISILFIAPTNYDYEFQINTIQEYNSTKAVEYGQSLAKDYPLKTVGHPDHDAAGLWIKSNLESWGYTVEEQHFKNIIDSKTESMTNYLAQVGTSEEIVAIFTNYDQAASTVEAASDTSAAAGVTLALAEMFSTAGPNLERSLLFVFLDGEEWGMLGAREFVKEYSGNVVASLVLEDIHIGEIEYIELSNSGQYGGYAPLWLRELYIETSNFHGVEVREVTGIDEFIDRSLEISFQDQGPINAADIPSITVLSIGDQEELAREIYHYPEDNWELMSEDTIEIYGEIAETAIRTIVSMDKIPQESTHYLKTSQGRSINSALITLACLVLFLPVYTIFRFEIRKMDKSSLSELKQFSILFGMFAMLFGVLKLFAFFRIIPRFDLYPAHPKHELLYDPDFLILGLFTALTGMSFYLVQRFTRDKWNEDRKSHMNMLLIIYFLITILGLVHNIFATVLFLVFPTYTWLPFVVFGTPSRRKLILTIPLGLLVHIVLIIQYAAIIFLKFEMIWYLFLGLGNHLFPPQVFLLFLALFSFIVRCIIVTRNDSD